MRWLDKYINALGEDWSSKDEKTQRQIVSDFIEDVYQSGLLEKDYMNILDIDLGDFELKTIDIESLTRTTQIALLTWIERSDRFSEGSLQRCIDEGYVGRLLNEII